MVSVETHSFCNNCAINDNTDVRVCAAAAALI